MLKKLESFHPLEQKLLFHRGITNFEDAHIFLNPDYERDTHSPFLIAGMEKAAERILSAIKKEEAVIIYSDYDHDGIPGGVILHDFFKKIGFEKVRNYIPHRYREGYGLHVAAIEEFAQSGVSLVITVDCGITDIEPVEVANKLGVDVIISDHHIPKKDLPPAYVVLNSKQLHDSYPDNMLCGAAVAFKLVQALIHKGNFDLKEGWEKWLLDLVGISTVADMVPLVKENRVLAHYGLKVLRKTPRVGLLKLLRKLKIQQQHLTEDDVGFMVAPRINAASRMADPYDAFLLLSTVDEVVADKKVSELEKLNNERKGVVGATVKEIKKTLEGRGDLPPVLVLGNPLWRPGLLGLTANTLMEEYQRPIFLWGREGGEKIKGSCRSDGTVSVLELMAEADVFEEFGGHELSGGFSVPFEQVHLLEASLVGAYLRTKREIEEGKELQVDEIISLSSVTWRTYSLVERFAPFGIGNPKPLFLFENVRVVSARQFGKEENHLELILADEGGKRVKAIGFFMNLEQFTPFALEIGSNINLAATLEKSTFRGTPELRLRIVDVL